MGGVHVDELLDGFAGGAPNVEGRRRTSCSAMVHSNDHPGPFGRRWSPARSDSSPGSAVLSPTDASLSRSKTWPDAPGISPAGPPAAVVSVASCGMNRRPDASIRGAAQARTGRRTCARNRTARTTEAAFDTARNSRAGSSVTARIPMPPFSGHGAPAVVNIKFSDGNWRPRRPGVSAPGLR